jgi:hypothetical protein
METRIWSFDAPQYPGGDYAYLFVNGALEWKYRLPDMKVHPRIAKPYFTNPLYLPEELRSNKDFRITGGLRLPHRKYYKVIDNILVELAKDPRNDPGICKLDYIRPGMPLLPVTLKVPSRPFFDVLHSASRYLVFSRRLVERLEDAEVTGVRFAPIDHAKFGRGDPRNKAPIPIDLEPETLVDLLATEVGECPYRLGLVHAMTGNPIGVLETIDEETGFPILDLRNRRFELARSNWPEVDFSILETTAIVLVTDRVKKIMESMPAPNVVFEPFPLVDE